MLIIFHYVALNIKYFQLYLTELPLLGKLCWQAFATKKLNIFSSSSRARFSYATILLFICFAMKYQPN